MRLTLTPPIIWAELILQKVDNADEAACAKTIR